MQGKERNITRINRQFKDRSWAEMQKILDAEMPQDKKDEKGNKRYLLLLLFLFVGFGSGVGTMFYFSQQEKINAPIPVELNKKEIAKNDNAIRNLEKTNIQSIAGNFQKANKNQNPKGEVKNQYSEVAKTKIKYKKENVLINNSAASEITKNNYIPFTNEFQEERDNSRNLNENQNFIEQSNLEKEQIPAVDLIASKTSFFEDPFLDKKINYLNTPKDKKWSFGLILGTYTNNKKIIAGITFGGKVTLNLDRRFTLGGGLQYSILSGYQEGNGFGKSANDLDITPGITLEEDTTSNSLTEVLSNLDNNFLQSLSKNADLPISSLHYIEMPVEIAFRFSEKFQLNLGFKMGYLINAISDGSVNFSRNSNSPTFSTAETTDNFTTSFNRFDFATGIGIGFYPTKKFGIDLRYNHGLVDITNDEYWPANQINANKNIQLSVLYFFGKGK